LYSIKTYFNIGINSADNQQTGVPESSCVEWYAVQLSPRADINPSYARA